MSTLLLFPPAADPAHPPMGIASLAGYLIERGKPVTLVDLNVRAYNELLSARSLGRCARSLHRSLKVFESKASLAGQYRGRYRETAENLLSADYLIARVDKAREQMRDPKTYVTRQSYARAATIVRRAMQFVSAAHYPAQWTPGGFSMSHDCTDTLGVLQAVKDRRENLFLPFFERIVPELLAPGHRVIGISLNYYGQLIPAITLASVVRKLAPQAFVVIGGGLICFFEDRWEVLAGFGQYVDGWVPFEGERPLFDLVEALDGSGDLSGVRGVVHFENGKPKYRAAELLPTAEIPAPNYDGLRLGEYLAPEPVLPLLSSRGCYWGRCTFCSHARLYREHFRKLSTDDIMRVILQLRQKYSASSFYFVDEAIPPATATGVAQAVVASNLAIRWFGETRMERSYTQARLRQLYQGGCRMLIFGLESAVPRVLNAMDKGITPQTASRILHDCAAVGIRAFIMFFTGFPSETRAEAEQTVNFVEQHADCVTHVATSRFVAEERALVFRQRHRYGLSIVSPERKCDLKTWCTYHVGEGMQPAEVAEFVKDLERRPSIRPSGSFLISRSHLIFLPPGQRVNEQLSESEPTELSCPERLVPRRSDALLHYEFAFNLDEVQRSVEAQADPVRHNATSYIFDQENERLIEVGHDGTPLLGVCDGRYTLAEILEAVGSNGRETTLSFLADLGQRKFLTWEQLP